MSQTASPESRAPAPLAGCVDRALEELARLSGSGAIPPMSGGELLMERAWLGGAGFTSGQSTSGKSRLLATRDGTLAIGLVRPEDWELIPAWLETDNVPDWQVTGWQESEASWQHLGTELVCRETLPLIERGRLIGLPVAATGGHRIRKPLSHEHLFDNRSAVPTARDRVPLVIDLSALWAGPLCTHLLQQCGADVIKVESPTRPDGARSGNLAFYQLLNQNKRAVSLDLTQPQGQRALRQLLGNADIVIESSRPRALRQMGIRAEEIVTNRPDLIWISITGYGRDEPQANWTAFGDDAGTAGGLSDVMKTAVGTYEFAGDAIADPLTGCHAALAAWRAWHKGEGGLITLALADVAAWCLAEELARTGETAVANSFARWWREVSNSTPRAGYNGRPANGRPVTGPVAETGQHTQAVLRSLRITC